MAVMRKREKQRIEAAKQKAVNYRNYRRVRDRALAKLSREYPEAYRAFYEEELKADENMGKKWLDIAGNTKPRNFRRG
jgi:hypothetical protein